VSQPTAEPAGGHPLDAVLDHPDHVRRQRLHPTGITDDGSEVSLISYDDTLISGDTNSAPTSSR
jgi:hypothetical protein